MVSDDLKLFVRAENAMVYVEPHKLVTILWVRTDTVASDGDPVRSSVSHRIVYVLQKSRVSPFLRGL